MKKSILLYLVAALLVACNNDDFKLEKGFELVAMEERAITSVQPMTGLVMWTTHSQRGKYAPVISLEYQYCLPFYFVSFFFALGYLRNQLPILSLMTPKRASLNMPPLIFDVPSTRLTKITGTSFILKPHL